MRNEGSKDGHTRETRGSESGRFDEVGFYWFANGRGWIWVG
jgi:hypothetical protein